MSGKLKPCPFCGGKNILQHGYSFTCDDCQATGPKTRINGKGAELWNNRPGVIDISNPPKIELGPMVPMEIIPPQIYGRTFWDFMAEADQLYLWMATVCIVGGAVAIAGLLSGVI